MIQWAALKALPWKWIAAGVLALALILTGVRVHAWREAYKALPGLEDALAREEGCQDGSKCYERQKGLQEAADHAANLATESYEAELAALRDRPPVRRVIRVCPAPRPGDVRHAAATGGTDATGPAAGIVHGPVELDTGPLFELAREADTVAARLRALQEWNKALSIEKQKPAG